MKTLLINALIGSCGGFILAGKGVAATGKGIIKVGQKVELGGMAMQTAGGRKIVKLEEAKLEIPTSFEARINRVIDMRLAAAEAQARREIEEMTIEPTPA